MYSSIAFYVFLKGQIRTRKEILWYDDDRITATKEGSYGVGILV